MTIRYREQAGTRGPLVVTDTCALCGAVRDEHFKHFADHVYTEHDWNGAAERENIA